MVVVQPGRDTVEGIGFIRGEGARIVSALLAKRLTFHGPGSAKAGMIALCATLLIPGAASAQPRERVVAVQPDARLDAIIDGGQGRVVGVESIDDKLGQRRARVVIDNPRSRTAAAVIVDLASGRVLDVERLEPQRIPFTQAQLEQATTIALRSADVRMFLGRDADRFRARTPGGPQSYAVEGFALLSNNPRDPCSRSRCVDLLFFGVNRYLTGRRVTVDLGSGRATVVALVQGEHHE